MLIESLGWIGTLSYLLAYFLLTTKKLQADRPLFHVLNIIGAVGLVFNALKLKDYPNLAANLVWGLIALIALIALSIKSK